MPTRRCTCPISGAAERTFQLVTQVAGRTGRGEKGGRVLVQTFSPEHPAIRAAVHHDFAAFAREELPMREAQQLSARGNDDPTDRARYFAGANESMRADHRRSAACIGRHDVAAAASVGAGRRPVCETARRTIAIICSCTDPMAMPCASWFARATDGLETTENLLWTVDVDPFDML